MSGDLIFRPNCKELLDGLISICKELGLEGVSPLQITIDQDGP